MSCSCTPVDSDCSGTTCYRSSRAFPKRIGKATALESSLPQVRFSLAPTRLIQSPRRWSPGSMLAGQSESLNDFDDLVPLVALSTGEVDELPGHRDDGAPLRRRTGHRDTAPTAKSQETFVSERAQCSQDGVVVQPRTAARSRAGGSRSPGRASPSAMDRRIAAATCTWSGV